MKKTEILGSSASTVTGAATVIGGKTGAMALATHIGTASTGTAISSLSGAAATNAATAWLGGGGMAAGTVVLTAIPVVGGIIAAGGIGYAIWKAFK